MEEASWVISFQFSPSQSTWVWVSWLQMPQAGAVCDHAFLVLNNCMPCAVGQGNLSHSLCCFLSDMFTTMRNGEIQQHKLRVQGVEWVVYLCFALHNWCCYQFDMALHTTYTHICRNLNNRANYKNCLWNRILSGINGTLILPLYFTPFVCFYWSFSPY